MMRCDAMRFFRYPSNDEIGVGLGFFARGDRGLRQISASFLILWRRSEGLVSMRLESMASLRNEKYCLHFTFSFRFPLLLLTSRFILIDNHNASWPSLSTRLSLLRKQKHTRISFQRARVDVFHMQTRRQRQSSRLCRSQITNTNTGKLGDSIISLPLFHDDAIWPVAGL